MYRLASCPFCSAGIRKYWPAVSVWRCTACTLMFRNPVPSHDDLTHLYTKSWSEPDSNRAETGGTDLMVARVFARRLASSLGRRDLLDVKILEFGAGRGTMLTAMAELGAEVYGIEPFGIEHIRNQGFMAYRSLAELPSGVKFDGVVSIDVMEHLARPWEELSQLRELLVSRGWLYAATLNTDGLNARLTRERWREVRKLGHLMFFNSSNFDHILRFAGFVNCRRLRWLVSHSEKPYKNALLYVMQKLGVDGELRYLAYTV
jgi:SAM-dependent methyltransferase